MQRFICLFLMFLMLAVPVSASIVEVNNYGSASLLETSAVNGSSQEANSGIALLAVNGDLTGGYYFVCNCTFGNGIKFYVPLEWAHDAFTVDSSGALVNLSNSTCYAYCPDYPDYTFSCSRFNTFVYRMSGTSTYDLAITEITDTNMSLFQDNGIQLTDSEILVLIAGLIFIVAAIIIIRR